MGDSPAQAGGGRGPPALSAQTARPTPPQLRRQHVKVNAGPSVPFGTFGKISHNLFILFIFLKAWGS